MCGLRRSPEKHMRNLIQKKKFKPTLEFLLDGKQLKVTGSRLFSRSSFQLDVRELRKGQIEQKNTAVGAMITLVVCCVLIITMACLLFTSDSDETVVMMGFFIIIPVLFAFYAFSRFRKNTFDDVTFVFRDSGQPAISLYRNLPNPNEFQHFVSALNQSIDGQSDQAGFANFRSDGEQGVAPNP